MQIRSDSRTEFVRWRATGDLQALARVFDLVGQELLLVACHVAARGVEPEDLVQDTFLTAIQRADRFDAERALEPWLVGILVNVARSARRRGVREHSGIELPNAAQPGDASDAAAASELAHELHAAIAFLPVPQREVVTLHLVHGMTPTEIAHASSRPVGTVKSWISRSLDEVRRRLPAGYAAALGSLLRGMQRMDELRALVLDAAGRGVAGGAALAAPAAVVPAARQVARAAPWWVPAGVLVALGAIALATRPSPAAPDAGRDGPSADAGPDGGRDAPAGSARSAVRTDAPPAAVAGAAAEPGCRLTIVGEAVGASFGFRGSLLDPLRTDATLVAREFASGDDGIAVLADVPYGAYVVLSDRGDGVVVDVRAPEQTCTVPLPRGHDVRGRVADDRGAGVAAATVWMSFDGRLDEGVPVAVTDATGAFAVRAVAAGRHLQARARGWRASALQRVAPRTVEDAAAAVAMDFRLDERGATVRCEVVDADGRPVAGARVQLGGSLPRAPSQTVEKLRDLRAPWVAATDANGVATCDVAPVTGELLVFARAPGLPGIERRIATGAAPTTVRLTLPRPAVVAGTLRGAAGTPRRGQVNALGEEVTPAITTPLWLLPRCLVDADGRYRLTGVPPGAVRVKAVADEGVAERTFVLRGGDEVTWDPEPRRDGAIDGVVTAADGRGLAGCRVRAAMVGSPPVDTAVAADGTFALRGLVDADFELLVLPPAPAGFVLHRHHAARPGQRVALHVPTSSLPRATVRGRVGAELRSVELTGATGAATLQSDGGGAFAFADVPPGRYHLLAATGTRYRAARSFAVDAGAELDLGMLVPDAQVRLQVRCEELRDEVVDVVLRTEDCQVMVHFARLRDGTAQLDALPGTHWLALYRGGEALATRRLVVAPDTSTVTLSPARGTEVHLLAVPVVPTTALRVVWEIDGPGGVQRHLTGRAAGLAAHTGSGLSVRLAAGTHTVRARRPDGPTVSVALTVPFAPGAAPPLLRLP
jgi:RNA polymerase sigma factor (sigma-70 family)